MTDGAADGGRRAGSVDGGRPGATDRITITGLRARGFHGVLPEERCDGQEFGADVILHVDTRAAAASDDLAATVNYAEVAQEAVAVLAGAPARLIETVAAAIAERALRHPAVRAVDVTVHKPQAPIPLPFDDVTVRVHRSAEEIRADRSAADDDDGDDDTDDVTVRVHRGAEEVRADRSAADDDDGVDASDDVTVRGQAEADGCDPGSVRGPADAGGRDPGHYDVVVALGANLGEARATLHDAVTQLDRHHRVAVAGVSPLARTTAVVPPGEPPQPDYLNAVVVVRTDLPPRELLALCQGIELAHGRVRTQRWAARPLDLDLVAAGPVTWDDSDLTLPHPRAHERAFVLAPWARLDPWARLRGHGAVADLAADAGNDVEWVAEDWWER